MALSREAKEKQLAQLSSALSTSQLTVVCDYRGLTVAEMQELRGLLKAAGSSFKVIKKTLLKKGLEDNKLTAAQELDLDGQLGLAFGEQDEVSVAQVLAKFAKDHPSMEIKSAIAPGGNLMSAAEIAQLATLPSQAQLRGMLVGTMAGPISGLARVLAGNLQSLVRALQQIEEQKA